LGVGSLLLTERTSALDRFLVEGTHYLGFSSAAEAAAIIINVLAAPDKPVWQEIALRGQRQSLEIFREERLRRDLLQLDFI
jgi:hypothetical protein